MHQLDQALQHWHDGPLGGDAEGPIRGFQTSPRAG